MHRGLRAREDVDGRSRGDPTDSTSWARSLDDTAAREISARRERGLYRLFAQRMRGYAEAQARQIFRDLVDMPAEIAVGPRNARVHFQRRAHLPILLASGLLEKPVAVPWWGGARLELTA